MLHHRVTKHVIESYTDLSKTSGNCVYHLLSQSVSPEVFIYLFRMIFGIDSDCLLKQH
jgi:hypothetical protein